ENYAFDHIYNIFDPISFKIIPIAQDLTNLNLTVSGVVYTFAKVSSPSEGIYFIREIQFDPLDFNFENQTVDTQIITIQTSDTRSQSLTLTIPLTVSLGLDTDIFVNDLQIESEFLHLNGVTENSWWRFDDGSGLLIYNDVGSGNGTLVGSENWVSGRVGDFALNLDGIVHIPLQPDDFSINNGTSLFDGELESIDSNYTTFEATPSGGFDYDYDNHNPYYQVLWNELFSSYSPSYMDHLYYPDSYDSSYTMNPLDMTNQFPQETQQEDWTGWNLNYNSQYSTSSFSNGDFDSSVNIIPAVDSPQSGEFDFTSAGRYGSMGSYGDLTGVGGGSTTINSEAVPAGGSDQSVYAVQGDVVSGYTGSINSWPAGALDANDGSEARINAQHLGMGFYSVNIQILFGPNDPTLYSGGKLYRDARHSGASDFDFYIYDFDRPGWDNIAPTGSYIDLDVNSKYRDSNNNVLVRYSTFSEGSSNSVYIDHLEITEYQNLVNQYSIDVIAEWSVANPYSMSTLSYSASGNYAFYIKNYPSGWYLINPQNSPYNLGGAIHPDNTVIVKYSRLLQGSSFSINIDMLRIDYSYVNYANSYADIVKPINFAFLNRYDTGFDSYKKLYDVTISFDYTFTKDNGNFNDFAEFSFYGSNFGLTKDGSSHSFSYTFTIDSTSLNSFDAKFKINNGDLSLSNMEYDMEFKCLDQSDKIILQQDFEVDFPNEGSLSQYEKDNGMFFIDITYDLTTISDGLTYYNTYGRQNKFEIIYGIKADGSWYSDLYGTNSSESLTRSYNVSQFMDGLSLNSFEDFNVTFVIIGHNTNVVVSELLLKDYRTYIPATLNFTTIIPLQFTDTPTSLELLYSYRTNITQPINFTIWNFNSQKWDVISSVNYDTFAENIFTINPNYFDINYEIRLNFFGENDLNDFELDLDMLKIFKIDYVITPILFANDQDPLTFSGWVKVDTLKEDAAIYGEYNTNGNTRNYINIRTDGALAFDQYMPSGGAAISDDTLVDIGNWTHIAFVKTNETVIFYKNGVQFGDIVPHTETYSGSSPTHAGFGARYYNSGWSHNILNGTIDDFRFFSSELTPEMVQLIYNNSVGTIKSIEEANIKALSYQMT
ncbi:hypothetical protein LCGC14_1075330, partial [marine sediment metagenome]